MNRVIVSFAAWYGDKGLALGFPEGWRVSVQRLRKARSISDHDIREAVLNPIGSRQLNRIARGKRDAVIIIDDLTRPTPAHRLLPFLFRELERGGHP